VTSKDAGAGAPVRGLESVVVLKALEDEVLRVENVALKPIKVAYAVGHEDAIIGRRGDAAEISVDARVATKFRCLNAGNFGRQSTDDSELYGTKRPSRR
jgi:hypothetical protein